MSEERSYTAFAGDTRIASGDVRTMLAQVKACIDAGEERTLLIFEDQTGIQIDFNLRGSLEDVLAGLEVHPHFATPVSSSDKKPGPGRPSLGVVSREVSLLPRHWEWLGRQPQALPPLFAVLLMKRASATRVRIGQNRPGRRRKIHGPWPVTARALKKPPRFICRGL